MSRVLRSLCPRGISPFRLFSIAVTVGFVWAFVLPRTAKTQGTDSIPTGVVDSVGAEREISGLETYRAQYCGLCHAYDRADTGGIFGPPHNGMATIAAHRIQDSTYTGSATTAAGYIRESITDPEIYIVPGFETTVHRMPAYRHLDAVVIDAMVEFLLETDCGGSECAGNRPHD